VADMTLPPSNIKKIRFFFFFRLALKMEGAWGHTSARGRGRGPSPRSPAPAADPMKGETSTGRHGRHHTQALFSIRSRPQPSHYTLISPSSLQTPKPSRPEPNAGPVPTPPRLWASLTRLRPLSVSCWPRPPYPQPPLPTPGQAWASAYNARARPPWPPRTGTRTRDRERGQPRLRRRV